MTQKNNVTTPAVHSASAGKRILQGAGIALLVISFFLFSADGADPAWPKHWMMKPLIIVPVAGALGGLLYYLLDHIRYQGGWRKMLAIALSLIGYLIALWLGIVLGLDGTLWN